MDIDLHKVFTSASNFIKSPAEVDAHRKVDLEDKVIKEETKEKFHKLCDRYDQIISKGSADIGKTLLVEMDIDTGDNPPIACRPYTLPLKHHDWVKKEIEILDRAGIINKSISAWASPVVIVPKKSKPGEPPKRRMCVDFRRLNGKLPEVEKMTGGKGCISLVPLPKIDELYARLQGYKIFSTLDLRSRILPHWSLRECQTKDSFCDIRDRQIPVQQSSIRIGPGTSLLSDPDK